MVDTGPLPLLRLACVSQDGWIIVQKKPQDGKHSPVVQSAVLGGVLNKEFGGDPSNDLICPFIAGLGGPTTPAFPFLRSSLWIGEPCWRECTASPGESQPPGPPLPLLQPARPTAVAAGPHMALPIPRQHRSVIPSVSLSSRPLSLYRGFCCLSPSQDHFRLLGRLLGLYLANLLSIHP